VVGNDKLLFAAIDPPGLERVASLNSGFFTDINPRRAMSALARDPLAVLVDKETAKSFNLRKGDIVKIQLPSPSLGRPTLLTFRVAGTFIQFPGFPVGLDFVGNLSTYQQATGAVTPSYYLLRTDGSGRTNAQVDRALRTTLGTTVPARIDTTARVGSKDQTSIAGLSLTGLGRVEGLYTLLIASLGIVIFVLVLLVQRNAERAVMRALGLARRRLHAVVLGEAVIVAITSVVVGTGIGAPMAYMFAQILRRIFVVPPSHLSVPPVVGLLLVGLLVVMVTVSAVIIAAAARRLRLVELLRAE
jgi:ABC-type antimicrobial peptide transport system permease subunit